MKKLLLIIFLFTGMQAARSQQLAPSATHLQAAEEMLMATGINTQLDEIYQNVINQFTSRIPETKRTEFSAVIKSFLIKYMGWEALKADLAKIYAEEFSETELKELTRFYLTPLGKKVSQKLPVLQQKGMALGQKKVQDHQQELQEELKKAMQN